MRRNLLYAFHKVQELDAELMHRNGKLHDTYQDKFLEVYRKTLIALMKDDIGRMKDVELLLLLFRLHLEAVLLHETVKEIPNFSHI